jgi:hypothetical protein
MSAKKETFRATIETGLDNQSRLVCFGDVTEPRLGWRVTLERCRPYCGNPSVLLLMIRAVRPSDVSGYAATTHHVMFEEDPAEARYTQVGILEEGASGFTIPVQVA